jgi:hypothetical protein
LRGESDVEVECMSLEHRQVVIGGLGAPFEPEFGGPCHRLRGAQNGSKGVGEATLRKGRERRIDKRQGGRRQGNVAVGLTDCRCGVCLIGCNVRRRCRVAC